MSFLFVIALCVLVLCGVERVFEFKRKGRLILIILLLLWAVFDAVQTARMNPEHPFVALISFGDSAAIIVFWLWASTWLREWAARRDSLDK